MWCPGVITYPVANLPTSMSQRYGVVLTTAGAACHYATHINVSSAPRIVCTSSAEAAQDAQGKIEKDCAMSQLHVQTKESDEQVGCDIVGHQQGTSQAADSVRHAGYEAPEGACGNS